MNSITFTTGEFKEEKTSAWLAVFIKFAQTLGVLDLLEQVKVKMKKIDHKGVEQLKSVHHQIFMQNAQCLSATDFVIIDIDQSGLIANGKTYEVT